MKYLVSLVLSLVLALPVFAGKKQAANQAADSPCPPQPCHGKAFKKIDTDGDGFISKSEFIARAEKVFSRKDKDSDGKLSLAEFSGKQGKPGKQGKKGQKGKAAKQAREGTSAQ